MVAKASTSERQHVDKAAVYGVSPEWSFAPPNAVVQSDAELINPYGRSCYRNAQDDHRNLHYTFCKKFLKPAHGKMRLLALNSVIRTSGEKCESFWILFDANSYSLGQDTSYGKAAGYLAD